jgi:hypothetical protein
MLSRALSFVAFVYLCKNSVSVTFCLFLSLLSLFAAISFFWSSLRPFAEIPSSFRDQSGGADKAGDADR